MLKSLYILLLAVCISACSGDYLAKHDDTISEATYRQNIAVAHTGSTYLSGYIQSRDIDIWTFPDKKKLPDLVAKFDTAKTRIYIEVYTWTERDTVDAAIRAHARGVDVQVLLEGNVYGSPTINRDTAKKLTDAGIPVYYSDPDRFTFTHAKFFIFDDTYIVSTGNLTYSTFTKNRDFFLVWKNTEDLNNLLDIFSADTRRRFVSTVSDTVVVSPYTTRSTLVRYIQKSKKSVYILVQSLDDDILVDALRTAAARGVDVHVCTADKPDTDDDTQYLQADFRSSKVYIYQAKKPYMHAKVAIFDGDIAYVGSSNFTTNALDNNREVGILWAVFSIHRDILMGVYRGDCEKV